MSDNRIKQIIIAVAVLACLGALALWIILKPTNPGFTRLAFAETRASETLKFDRRVHRWRIPSSNQVTDLTVFSGGSAIRFTERGELILNPGAGGRKGLLFQLEARGTGSDPIRLTIAMERNGSSIFRKNLAATPKNKISHSFSRIIDFQQPDTLGITVEGKGLLTVSAPVLYDPVPAADRQLVIVIALDTLRHDVIGARHKNKTSLTPNLNRFRKESVLFSSAYAQSSWTLPSFTSLFTGLYEFHHGITREERINPDLPFMVEDLSRAHITAGIHGGAWLSGQIGNSRGFDFYVLGSRTKNRFAGRDMFRRAMTFLDSTPAQRLFLFLHTYAVHAPYNPPLRFLHRLNPNPAATRMGTFVSRRQFKRDVSEETRRAMIELYHADVMAFDHFFGEFLSYLRSREMYRNAVIVFLSDHGEEFADHGGWSHGHSQFNEMIHVPLMVKFPAGRYGGRVINQPTGIVDVFPTLLDWSGLEPEEKIDGISLMPILKDEADSPRVIVSSTTTCALFDILPKKIALMADHYKLIYTFDMPEQTRKSFHPSSPPPSPSRIEIYDLAGDPLEKNNLYPRRYDIYQRFEKELKKTIRKITAQLKRPRGKGVQWTAEELEELKTLGYLIP